MRFIIPLLLLCSAATYFFMSRKPQDEASEKAMVRERTIAIGQTTALPGEAPQAQGKPIETRGHIVSTVPSPAAETVKEWIDLGPAWEQEMQRSLLFVDAQNGEAIYLAYRKEVDEHQQRLSGNMNESVKVLSGMNGESDSEKEWMGDDAVPSVKQYNQLHSRNIKRILGEHYGYILEQKEAFINKN